jgi:hypothetical protein
MNYRFLCLKKRNLSEFGTSDPEKEKYKYGLGISLIEKGNTGMKSPE